MVLNLEILKKRINDAEVIFFDLDGTLIDTEPLYFRFWREASIKHGYELTKEEALAMRSRDKESAKEFLDKVSDGLLKYDEVKATRIELMSEYLKNHPIIIKDGAVDLLEKLRSKNKKIYIVTANAYGKAKGIIDSIGFEFLIDGIISAKDVERGKPFPDVYLYASNYVKKNPKEIIVFEDSPNGLISSSEAGCFTVMIEDMSGYCKDMKYVDAVIDSFIKLL